MAIKYINREKFENVTFYESNQLGSEQGKKLKKESTFVQYNLDKNELEAPHLTLS